MIDGCPPNIEISAEEGSS
ncbi:MAG: hypothetical protein ACPGED_05315 [Flavobacteriales bacterium]